MSISLSRDEHLICDEMRISQTGLTVGVTVSYANAGREMRKRTPGDAQEGDLRRVKRGVEKRDLNADGMKGNVLCLTEVRQNGSSEGRYEDRDFR